MSSLKVTIECTNEKGERVSRMAESSSADPTKLFVGALVGVMQEVAPVHCNSPAQVITTLIADLEKIKAKLVP